jgi:hypothetical protein
MHAESHLEVIENKRAREARGQCRFLEIDGNLEYLNCLDV